MLGLREGLGGVHGRYLHLADLAGTELGVTRVPKRSPSGAFARGASLRYYYSMATLLRILLAIPWALTGKLPSLRPLMGPLTDEDFVKRQARGNLHLQRGRFMTEADADRQRDRFVERGSHKQHTGRQ